MHSKKIEVKNPAAPRQSENKSVTEENSLPLSQSIVTLSHSNEYDDQQQRERRKKYSSDQQ